MKGKLRKIISLALLLGLLTACGASAPKREDMAANMATMAAPAPMAMESGGEMATGTDGSLSLPSGQKWIIDMVISTETEDLDQLIATLREQVSTCGGYLESENIQNGSRYVGSRSYRSADFTVRIPVEQLEQFTTDLEGISNVTRQNTQMTDITLQYSDTESRIAALKTAETRLMELLAQAENVSDMLEIESRLTDTRYELETVTSRLRRYDNQVDYATIYLDISEVVQYTPTQEQGVWARISQGFVENLKNLGSAAVNLFVWLLSSLPYLLVLAVLGFAAFSLLRRLRRSRKAKKQAKEQE